VFTVRKERAGTGLDRSKPVDSAVRAHVGEILRLLAARYLPLPMDF
jgi:hypothetical protein